MTRQEAFKLVYVIRSTYSNAYRGYTNADFDRLVDAWIFALEDYEYNKAALGLKIYITTDSSGFPPTPGQVIECFAKSKPQNELGELEAWAMVRKAVRNGIYGAKEEFAKLPEAVQKAVGNPENLTEWAQMEPDAVESVQQSHFVRAYRTEVKRAKDRELLPESVRVLLEGTPMLEAVQ